MLKLPNPISDILKAESAAEVHIGESKSQVFSVSGKKDESYFLKITSSDYVSKELQREVEILSWLNPQGIRVPSAVSLIQHEGRSYFLMTAIPGRSMAESALEMGLDNCMRLGAEFLAKLHSLDIRSCPFDRRLQVTRKLAFENLQLGLVDIDDLDKENQGRSLQDLWGDLQNELGEDLVFTHGDYCFPNIICQDGEITGVVDLGRAGISDRYQDIALFLRSFAFNIGEPNLNVFLNHYGLLDHFNEDKARFYRKLDEFF